MKRRIHSRKVKTLKLELPPEARKKQLTIIAYGNLVRIDKIPNLWCLFCDEDKQLHESLQPLSVLPYFSLGRHFNNSHLANSTTAPSLYHISVSKDKTALSELPRKLLQADLSKYQGQYHKQPCIKVRNKQIQLADMIWQEFSGHFFTLSRQVFVHT